MSNKTLLASFLFWMISWTAAVAQNGSGEPGIDTRGVGRVGVRTASRPPVGNHEQAVRPLYLTGKVEMHGGGLPPSMPRVELKCNGSVRKSVRTSPEGLFSIALGTNSPKSGVMDASLGGPTISTGGVNLSSQNDTDPYRRAGIGIDLGSGRVDLSTCVCEAVLPGFQSQPIALAIRSVFDSSEIGNITLYPSGEVKGTTISVNSLTAPGKAKDAFRKAGKEIAKKRVDYSKVEKHLKKATDLYPKYAEAWQFLGEVQLVQGKEPEARKSFQLALAADPRFLTPYLVLGELEIHAHEWNNAAGLMERAIELNPYLTKAHYFFALANYYLRQDKEAEESIKKVHNSDDAGLFPASHYLLGGIREDRGEYQAAAVEFRRFLETDPPEDLAGEVESKLGDWQSRGLIQLEAELKVNE